MNAKRSGHLFAAISPMLEPGERVDVLTTVTLKSVSVGRQVAVAAVTAVLTAGMLSLTPTPAPMYLALTDRRIFILTTTGLLDRPGEVQMVIPRAGLVRSKVKDFLLTSNFLIFSPGSQEGLKLTFPGMHRRDQKAMAAALPEVF